MIRRPTRATLVPYTALCRSPNGEKLIQSIQRTSKPGRRVYQGVENLKPVLDGLGISILSTNKGILSDREARRENVGGEVLCMVW